MGRPNLQSSLADLGQQPIVGQRYFPAWQRLDPFGWNVVAVTSIDAEFVHTTGRPWQVALFRETFAPMEKAS